MHVRRFRPEEWRELRALRLRALASDPTAFGMTYAEEAAVPDEKWKERAREGAAGARVVRFVAEHEGARVGMAGAWLVPEASPPVAELVAMWVAPEARGAGAARALIEAVDAWAQHAGASTLILWVNAANGRALRVYERAGFARLGPAVPGTRDPSRMFQKMERPFTGRAR